jgi:CHAT domain-containing protein
MTLNNLGIAFTDRIRGDKAENIEKAIENYNQALKVYTPNDLPTDWAMIQINLASSYVNRIKGDKVENIEQAIEHFNYALDVYTPKYFPVDWATTQNNLAAAYWSRIKGDRADNIEKAIYHYKQALKVRTLHDFPTDWAKTQNNLAAAYWSRTKGVRADNIEQAIEHYNQALKVRTQKDFPLDWATTQNNLANAYCDRIKGNKAKNIEKAIEHYNQALEVRTLHGFPIDWAGTQNNLANAYRNRIIGYRNENLEKALIHFLNALQIYKLESMPNEFRRTCRLLGDLYLDLCRWKDAIECYTNAMKADDLLYRSSLSAESKSIEVVESAYIYPNASYAAYFMNLAEEALLVLERGKTRLLSEALHMKIKQPEGVPNEEWEKYKQAAGKYIAATKFSDQEDYSQREKRTLEALEELDNAAKVIQKYAPGFLKKLDIQDILSIPDKETALLTFCITSNGSVGFAVSSSKEICSVCIPDFKIEDVDNLLFKLDEHGFIKGGLVGDYLNYLKSLDTNRREEDFQSWKSTLSDVLFNIGTNLFYPLLEKLPLHIKRLIFLPSGDLFLLPLHAIPLPDKQLLCQRYCISYAPSIQLLKEMKSKTKTVKGKRLYAVINPQEDPALVFSGCEGQAISRLFQNSEVNVGMTGTKATVQYNVPGKAYLHFSCHGSYNWNDPSHSGLHLFGGKTLSLADLQSDIVDMSSTRLVTLSACETGITDIVKGSADEFVGLPAGFMLAGVPCVVSSLWAVPDVSTAMLMERFYSNHIERGMDISLALQNAQLWVRDLTSRQVADNVEKCYRSGKWEGESKGFIERYREHYLKMAKESPDEKPFQHPYYWAAFTVNGA